ncbi:MAG: YegS/Rv2252/BmrU family lipid kinase [Oscillospiraceae bacterium]|nr:YegS/Rv2252/BmrU family lipid kinase [Oscillospiraceae bacterium]
MKKLLFFINPNAGHSGIRTNLLDVLQIFCGGDYDVRVHITAAPREITRILMEEGDNYDLVVSAGGDGTLNETVAGLMELNRPPVLGYIPAGTVNDVASSLGLSLDAVESARNIVCGEEMTLDIGSFNGRPFTYVAAFGAFTDVAYATPQDAKKALGRLAYLLQGVKALGEIKPIHAKVTADGIAEEGDFIFGMIASTKSVGGFRPKSVREMNISLNDGLSEVVFVRDIKNLLEFNDVATLALRMDFTDQRRFLSFQSNEVRVEFDSEVAWTLDGEDGGSCRAALIRNHNCALRIMVPRE